MQTAIAWHQPATQAPPRFQAGDIVAYQGFAMRIWMIFNLGTGLPPDSDPGVFYALRGNGMPNRVYFIVPASEIDLPLQLAT
ncbi:MAG: hypothetical protein U0232_10220 [Thermomicrobiales bacterium]